MIKLDPAQQPQDIENRSFAIIDKLVPEPRPFDGALWHIARRMIHTAGDVELLPHIVLSEEALQAGIAAMRQGCTVYTDTEMARCGMVARRLEPLGVRTQCILQAPDLAKYAAAHACTRSRAGILRLSEKLSGNIVAIGNAPTALLALLDVLKEGMAPPALIIGMPVGFVNAAESKELLLNSSHVHMSIRGPRGGSPLVASVVNALAILAK